MRKDEVLILFTLPEVRAMVANCAGVPAAPVKPTPGQRAALKFRAALAKLSPGSTEER